MFSTFRYIVGVDGILSRVESPLSKFIVWSPTLGYRVYDDIESFHINKYPNTWHEVILDKPQKLKFDIDAGYDLIPSADDYNVEFNTILTGIKDVFFLTYGITLVDNDIIITKSHSPAGSQGKLKRSNHIIIDNYYVSNSAQAREFTARLIPYIPSVTTLDTGVNKRTQNFRIVDCHKDTDPDRPKILVTGQAKLRAYITEVDDCTLLEDIADNVTQEQMRQLPNIDNVLQKHIPPEFEFRCISGRNVLLNRLRPSHCNCCNEIHHKDNSMYLRVTELLESTYIYEHCHQSTKSKLLEVYSSNGSPKLQKLVGGQITSWVAANDSFIKKIDGATLGTIDVRTYCEPTMRDFELVPTLYVKAMMKMGKTKTLLKYLSDYFPATNQPIIRFVSFRQTFSHNIKQHFKDFTLYSDVKGMLTDAKLIIQVESMHRLAITLGDQPPDLLILDESESIIEQFDSGLLKNFSDCFAKFTYLVKYSKHVVCMDANLSQRTINVIQHLRQLSIKDITTAEVLPGLLVQNTYKNAMDDTCYLTKDKSKWLGLLFACIEDDRVAIAISSLTDAKSIASAIMERFPNKKVGCYSSETTQKIKNEHFGDVHSYWSLYDVLIYTPTVSAGVSFELKHFNKMFGYFTDQSCPVETCTQMMGRIRNVSDKTYIIYITTKSSVWPCNINTIRQQIINHRERLHATYDEMGLTIQYSGNGACTVHESDYFTVWLENTRCRNISKMYFGRQLVRRLLETGANCKEITDETYMEMTGDMYTEDGILTPEVADIVNLYQKQSSELKDQQIESIYNAVDINDDIAYEIQQKEDPDCDDIAKLQKYKLRKYYKYDHPITRVFIKTYANKRIKRNYKNIVRLKVGCEGISTNLVAIQATEKERYDELYEYGNDFHHLDLNTTYVSEQHRLALCLLKVGGWVSMDDPTYVHFTEFNLDLYFEIIHDICREFNMRQLSTRDNPESIIDMFNKVLSIMYGVRVAYSDGSCKLQKNNKFTYDINCRTKPYIGS